MLQKRATSRSEPAKGASHACPFAHRDRPQQVAFANRSSLYRVTAEPDAKLRAQVPGVTGSSFIARPPWWLSFPLLTPRIWSRSGWASACRPAGTDRDFLARQRSGAGRLAVDARVDGGPRSLPRGLSCMPALNWPPARLHPGAGLPGHRPWRSHARRQPIRTAPGAQSFVDLDRRGLFALTGWMTLVAAPLSAVAAAGIHHHDTRRRLHQGRGPLVVRRGRRRTRRRPALLTAPCLVNWWSVRSAAAIEGAAGLSAAVLLGVASFATPPIRIAGPGGSCAASVRCWSFSDGAWSGRRRTRHAVVERVTVWFSGQHLGPFAPSSPTSCLRCC